MYDRFYDISRFCNEANHPAFDGEKIEIRSIVSFRGDPDETPVAANFAPLKGTSDPESSFPLPCIVQIREIILSYFHVENLTYG